MEWSRSGDMFVGGFMQTLSDPARMARELSDYRAFLGKNFSIEQLLKIYEIQAQAHRAAAVYDLPELMAHELFRAFNDGQLIKANIDINGEISISGSLDTCTEEDQMEDLMEDLPFC